MNPIMEKLKPHLDRAMAIKTAMTLFEWDNETLAPKEAGEEDKVLMTLKLDHVMSELMLLKWLGN